MHTQKCILFLNWGHQTLLTLYRCTKSVLKGLNNQGAVIESETHAPWITNVLLVWLVWLKNRPSLKTAPINTCNNNVVRPWKLIKHIRVSSVAFSLGEV